MFDNILLLYLINCILLSFGEYINECYKILGGSGKKISLKRNNENAFMLDTLKIKITIEEWTREYQKIYHQSTVFIENTYTDCSESWLIPNFIGYYTPFIDINIEIFWRDLKLEHFKLSLDPNFPSNVFPDYEGFKKNYKISLYFSHTEYELPQYVASNIKWTKKVKTIECAKALCMRVMNMQGMYSFMTEFKCPEALPMIFLDQFNTLKISSYEDMRMEKLAHREDYLAEIYQCEKQIVYSPISILVDDTIKEIELHIIAGGDGNSYKMKMSKEKDIFVSDSSMGYYFKLFEVHAKEESFERAFLKRKESYLQYHQIKDIKSCHLDETNIFLDIVKYRGKNYVVSSHIMLRDNNINLYYAIDATKKQEDRCFSVHFKT